MFEESGISEVVLPAGIRKLAPRTFQGCSQLKKFDFPEQLETIYEFCFSRSTLEAAKLPISVKTVGKEAFAHCSKLQTVELAIGSSLERLEAGAFKDTAVESFRAPGSLKFIGERAFADCAGLADIDLNEGLNTIENGAFAKTAFRSAVLPSSLRKMGKNVFSDSQLANVYYFKETTHRSDISAEEKLLPPLATAI